jgi:hypothetical protein
MDEKEERKEINKQNLPFGETFRNLHQESLLLCFFRRLSNDEGNQVALVTKKFEIRRELAMLRRYAKNREKNLRGIGTKIEQT